MAFATREGAERISKVAPLRSVKTPTSLQVLYTIQGSASRRTQQLAFSYWAVPNKVDQPRCCPKYDVAICASTLITLRCGFENLSAFCCPILPTRDWPRP